MKDLLTANNISKKFNNILAVNNLSFSIKNGEIFALLGPNGAGKTTTVRMLMNIIKPDTGTISYSFPDTLKNNSSRLGYLPEERGLYQEQSILKTLTYMGVIRGMNKKDAKSAAEKWLEQLELKDRQKDKINTLSKGNQQKIQFIASIIHKPAFAILDEPFSGFDPINQESFLTIIRDLRDKGTTILLSAHQMHLVERIADRILLINKGIKIIEGSINELNKENMPGVKLNFTFGGNPDLSLFKNINCISAFEIINNNEIEVTLNDQEATSELLSLASANYNIKSVNTVKVSLHDIFLQKIQGDDQK